MHGAIPPLCHTSSRHGVQLRRGHVFMAWYLVKHRDSFYLYLLSLKEM
jgi:hypothetical protein